MPLINYEISLNLKWSRDCFLLAGTAAYQVPEFKITDTKCSSRSFIKSRQCKTALTVRRGFLFFHLKIKMVKKIPSNIIFQLLK